MTSSGVFNVPGDKKGDSKGQRLIVVSNRLPVTISKDDNGEYHFKVSRRPAGLGALLMG
jgi:trehalose-6-phosphate synthase